MPCQGHQVRCGDGSRTQGIAYVVFFVASMLVSNPPADNASDSTWIARYTGHSEQAGHLATAFLLLLAGLALMTFLVALWRRIAEVQPGRTPSRLPIAAAGTAAALIGAGGMVMGYISGGEIAGKYPLPSADLLRMSNDLGFALAGVGGSWAAAVAVAALSVQGHAAGVFGTKMRAAGIVTALALLFADAFRPARSVVRLGSCRIHQLDSQAGGHRGRTCSASRMPVHHGHHRDSPFPLGRKGRKPCSDRSRSQPRGCSASRDHHRGARLTSRRVCVRVTSHPAPHRETSQRAPVQERRLHRGRQPQELLRQGPWH